MACTCTKAHLCIVCYNSKVRPSIEKSHENGEVYCKHAKWCNDPTVNVIGWRIQSRFFPILTKVRRGIPYKLENTLIDSRIQLYIRRSAPDIKVKDQHLVRAHKPIENTIAESGPMGVPIQTVLAIPGSIGQLRSGKVKTIHNVAFGRAFVVQKHKATRRLQDILPWSNLRRRPQNHQSKWSRKPDRRQSC